MSQIKGRFSAALGLSFAMGCASADMGEPIDSSETEIEAASAEAVSSAVAASGTEASRETEALASNSDVAIAEGAELARLEFEDGASVRFERLGKGVLITELRTRDIAPRLPEPGTSALDTFRALAPTQDIPEALLRMDALMYPTSAQRLDPALGTGASVSSRESEVSVDSQRLEQGAPAELSGGAFPFDSFVAQMCDFAAGTNSYTHGDVTASHVHETEGIHNAYFAIGVDIGTISSRACVNDTICGNSITINGGFFSSNTYDAGLDCDTPGSLLCRIFGCPTVCTQAKVSFSLDTTKIANQIRFHECAQFFP